MARQGSQIPLRKPPCQHYVKGLPAAGAKSRRIPGRRCHCANAIAPGSEAHCSHYAGDVPITCFRHHPSDALHLLNGTSDDQVQTRCTPKVRNLAHFHAATSAFLPMQLCATSLPAGGPIFRGIRTFDKMALPHKVTTIYAVDGMLSVPATATRVGMRSVPNAATCAV